MQAQPKLNEGPPGGHEPPTPSGCVPRRFVKTLDDQRREEEDAYQLLKELGKTWLRMSLISHRP